MKRGLSFMSQASSRSFRGRLPFVYTVSALSVALCWNSTALIANDVASAPFSCDAYLQKFNPAYQPEAQMVDHSIEAVRETHSLLDLIRPDANGETLATKHPFIVMSAAQRLLAIVEGAGSEAIPDPRTGEGTVIRYNLFSSGSEVTGGRRVIGQYHAIEQLVAHLRAAADGHRSGRLVPLLVGGPGSGKSEFIEIFREGLQHQTLHNSQNFAYTYGFVGLEKIPSLRADFPEDDTGVSPEYRCPHNDSPLVPFPEVFQNAIVNQASAAVGHLIKRAPSPKRKMCLHCQHIHDQILAHYFRDRTPTPAEVVEVLNKHIVVHRLVMGTPGTAPIIDNPGNDVDLGTFFAKVNPSIAFGAGRGISYPLSQMINGQIPSANGGPVLLEEFLKWNPKKALEPMLTAIQGHRFSIFGSGELNFDVYFMAATNTDDVAKIAALTEAHKSPILDRMVPIFMNWTIRPHEIGEILAYEQPTLEMRALNQSGAPVELVRGHGNLSVLFPRPESPLVEAQGPDGRFDLSVRNGAGEHETHTHISPQAYMYIARVVALSRMKLDRKTLAEYNKEFGTARPDVAAPIFTSEEARLNMLEGRGQLDSSALQEFWRYSDNVGEGTFGISARDASKWLAAAVSEAQKPGNDGCVTLTLVRETLNRLMTGKEPVIGANKAERAHISRLAGIVSAQISIPEVARDMFLAFAESDGDTIKQTYDQVVSDLLALNANSQETHHISPETRRRVQINHGRLERIKFWYQTVSGGQQLAINEIAMFKLNQDRAGSNASGREQVRHPVLLKAVARYEAENSARHYETRLERIVEILAGTKDPTAQEKALADSTMSYLREKKGYCPVCASQAVHLLRVQPNNPGPVVH